MPAASVLGRRWEWCSQSLNGNQELSQGDIRAGLWRSNRSLPGRVARQVAGQGHGASVDRQASDMRGRVETDLGLGATEALGRLMFLAFYSVRVGVEWCAPFFLFVFF